MLALVAKKKEEKKERFYNGKMFVCGKNHALDVSGVDKKFVDTFIKKLYDYLETTPEAGTIEYYTKEI